MRTRRAFVVAGHALLRVLKFMSRKRPSSHGSYALRSSLPLSVQQELEQLSIREGETSVGAPSAAADAVGALSGAADA